MEKTFRHVGEIQKLEKKVEQAQINCIPLAGNEQCMNTICAYGKI